MKSIFRFHLFILFISNAFSQDLTPDMLGFEAFSFENEELGKVDYYLSKGSKELPLLVYLDGSGPFPLFQQTDRGIGSTVVIDFQNLSKEYRILLISKPGVPFVDKVGIDADGFPKYDAPEEYTNNLTLDWRVKSANKAINEILEKKVVDSDNIILLGFSEGAQVAPHLAVVNNNVSHILLFGGNGLNQLFDLIISARMNAKIGKITEKEAQKNIDSLFVQYRQIYKNPKNTEKAWWGHSYARWSSFTNKNPLDALVELDIPIYIAKGSLDENSVLSADYIQLEFIRRGKDNLTYKTYPSYDHQFNEIQFENGQFKQAIPKIQEVMQEAFLWLNNYSK